MRNCGRDLRWDGVKGTPPRRSAIWLACCDRLVGRLDQPHAALEFEDIDGGREVRIAAVVFGAVQQVDDDPEEVCEHGVLLVRWPWGNPVHRACHFDEVLVRSACGLSGRDQRMLKCSGSTNFRPTTVCFRHASMRITALRMRPHFDSTHLAGTTSSTQKAGS
ncbi:hypothetical protein PCAR4_210108 [Paraburkholderia caribensis]|nr:hypothetical protein PCAR4_210108 [Paraburkholderia caribensis]